MGKLSAEGVMRICQLHDDDNTRYADQLNPLEATPATLDGTEGDIYMLEPRYWYKGGNDSLKGKKYALYASARPTTESRAKVIKINTLRRYSNTAIATNKLSYADSRVSRSGYTTLEYMLEPCQLIHFPSIAEGGASQYGALWLDASARIVAGGKVISSEIVDGQYLITTAPEGAKSLVFSVPDYLLEDERGIIVYTDSNNIYDLEPAWVEHSPTLIAQLKTSVDVNSRIGSVYNPSASSVITGKRVSELLTLAQERGLSILSYEARKDILQLAYAKYGTRDVSAIVGYPNETYDITSNHKLALGLSDTYLSNGSIYYKSKYGVATEIATNGAVVRVLGYDNLASNVGEFAIDIRSDSRIVLFVGGRSVSRTFETHEVTIALMAHERYMDTVPTKVLAGSGRYVVAGNYAYQSLLRADRFDAVNFSGVQGPRNLNYMGANNMSSRGVGSNNAYPGTTRLMYSGAMELISSTSEYKALPIIK